jgi:hypothetical protein
MANRNLTWEFSLLDKISSPASKAEKSLSKLSVTLNLAGEAAVEGAAGLKKLADGSEKAATGARHASREAESLATHWAHVVELGKEIWHVVEGVGEFGFEMGKAAIEAASFKETTLVSLTTIMGSADAASETLTNTIKLASKLPIETEEALQGITKLTMAGYNRKQLFPIEIAASDVKAFNPGRADAMDVFLRQISEIKQVGLTGRHLQALSQETNISEEGILSNLMRYYGRDKKTIEHMISKKLIDKEAAVAAILQAVADKEGGKLGPISKKLGQTVSGLWATIKSRKLEFLMDLDQSPAYKTFRNFLSNVAKATDPFSPFATRVKASFSRTFGGVFGSIFGDFAGEDGVGKIEAGLTKALQVVELIGGGFQVAIGFGKGFLDSLTQGLGTTNSLFGPDGSLDQKKLQAATVEFEKMGHELGEVVKLVGELAAESNGLLKKLGADGRFGDWLAKKRLSDTGGDERAFDPMHPEKGGLDFRTSVPAIQNGLGVSPVSKVQNEIDRVATSPVGRGQKTSGQSTSSTVSPVSKIEINIHAPGATKETVGHMENRLKSVLPGLVNKPAQAASLTPAGGN